MLSYKILRFASWLMLFSVGYLFGEIFYEKFGNDNDKKFLKYARIILLLIGTIMIIWLLFNKELFHWNYDIATGEPVDHYSTYGKCVVYTVITLVSNTVAGIISIKRKSNNKYSKEK